MSKIRSKYTKLDRTMDDLLKKSGLPYRMYPHIEGSPDFLIGQEVALFCDSSFWHGRDWHKLKKRLASGGNAEYWISHIRANRRRDREIVGKLTKAGYSVIRIWDTEVFKDPMGCIGRIREILEHRERGSGE